MNAFEKPLDEIYRKLKLYFYREMALHTNREDNGLSITESFCMESIYALDHPTIAQFANFMNISSPNATYKIHHLIAKGYLEKIQSPRDKREYYLQPTEKYMRYHAMNRASVFWLSQGREQKSKRLLASQCRWSFFGSTMKEMRIAGVNTFDIVPR